MTDKTTEKILTLMDISRSRKRWRLVAILFILIFIFSMLAGGASSKPEGPYVAGVKVEDFIGDNPKLIQTLNDLAMDDNVEAVVVYINSPGGAMQPALDAYHAIRRVAERKPVVAHMGQTAASAGYLMAVAADYIIAGEATLTGSVGVFLPLVDATELAQKIGVTSRTIHSGEDKLATSPFDKVSNSSEKYLQNLVSELKTLFVQYVTERRVLTNKALETVETGRVFTGQTAKALNLVDALTHQQTATQWLKAEKGIETKIHWLEATESKTWIEQVLAPANLLPSGWLKTAAPTGALAISKL